MPRTVAGTRTAASRNHLTGVRSISFSGAAAQWAGTDSAFVYGLVNFTIFFWINSAAQNGKTLFSEASSSSNNQLYQIVNDTTGSTGKIIYSIKNDAGTSILTMTSVGVPLDSTWHSITITDKSGVVNMYIDGRFDKTQSYTRGTLTLNRCTIAAIRRLSGTINNTIALIDDFAVYDRVLSRTEIGALHLSGLKPGAYVSLPCNEGSGTTLNDISGNARNFTVNGGTYSTSVYTRVRATATGRQPVS